MQLSLSLAQRRRLALAVVALVAAVVAWQRLGGHGGSTQTPLVRAPIVPRSASAARAGPSAPRLVVDVVGAVRRPGLVRLSQHARVADAVRAAGGLTRGADPLLLNLAAPVADGEQVLVAARGSPAASAGPGGAPANAGAPVDLNSATAEQLDTLPGIGPVTAQKIVAYRQQHGPFTSVAGLDAISGIGPARIKDLQGLVVP